MFNRKINQSDPSAIRTLDRQELARVAGGYIEVVKGDDGAPGCAVWHTGPAPVLLLPAV